mmetsp:Transcript_113029/g.258919  ORF Transcript_113029/g.258919 Transcript_113029/m.258919 type:complete len:412 (+) Transcript_113029:1110-2345(+)
MPRLRALPPSLPRHRHHHRLPRQARRHPHPRGGVARRRGDHPGQVFDSLHREDRQRHQEPPVFSDGVGGADLEGAGAPPVALHGDFGDVGGEEDPLDGVIGQVDVCLGLVVYQPPHYAGPPAVRGLHLRNPRELDVAQLSQDNGLLPEDQDHQITLVHPHGHHRLTAVHPAPQLGKGHRFHHAKGDHCKHGPPEAPGHPSPWGALGHPARQPRAHALRHRVGRPHSSAADLPRPAAGSRSHTEKSALCPLLFAAPDGLLHQVAQATDPRADEVSSHNHPLLGVLEPPLEDTLLLYGVDLIHTVASRFAELPRSPGSKALQPLHCAACACLPHPRGAWERTAVPQQRDHTSMDGNLVLGLHHHPQIRQGPTEAGELPAPQVDYGPGGFEIALEGLGDGPEEGGEQLHWQAAP